MESQNVSVQSELLVNTLKNKRKKVKNEMIKATENQLLEEDAAVKMKTAQERIGKKLKSSDTEMMMTEMQEKTVSSPGTFDEDAMSAPPTTRSTLSKTGGLTPRKAALKAKLAEKLKVAKDKGKDEAYNETVGTHRLAGERGKTRTTRFDETGQAVVDGFDDEDEMEKSLKLKMKTLVSATQSPLVKDTKDDIPFHEEAYDFFTHVWEETDKESEKVKSKEVKSKDEITGGQTEASAEQTDETDEKKKTRTEEEEGLLDDEDEECSWLPYQVQRAEYVPFEEKMKAEEDLYFIPSMFEAPVEQKIFADSSGPRHLEEEGFYVGTRPYVPTRNLNRMENRLLKEISAAKDIESGDPNDWKNKSSKKWFGEDGRLITLPDPVKEISSRPPIIEEVEPNLKSKYFEAELPEGNDLMRSGGRYQLDVDVNTIMFTHHHLFSQEHVRSSQLTRLYEEYVSRMKKQSTEYLTGKLKALKSAQQHIKDNIRRMKTDSSKETELSLSYQEQRLKEYSDDIRLTRKQRDFEMFSDRTLVKNAIRIWKDIKRLRQIQLCINTPVKLIIKTEAINQADDEREWEEDVQEELFEIQEEINAEFEKQMETYKIQLDLWKQQKLKKKQVRNDDDSQDNLNKSTLIKPEKPILNTDAEIRQRIEAKYNEIRRKPGEPKLYIELTNNTPITNIDQCPRAEQQRRNDVNKYKLFVKVLFNNKEVSKTTAKPLGHDFLVRFAQIFNIEITHWPESVTYEIHETYGMAVDHLCTVYGAIPDSNTTAGSSHLIEHDFSSELKRTHPHEGVGSGVPMKSLDANANLVNLTTSGFLNASVVWSVDTQGNVLVPSVDASKNPMQSGMRGMDVITAIGMSGLADMSKLCNWVEESHLDPNDPANADIMHLMRPITIGGGVSISTFQMPEHFRLEHVQEEFNFATDEDIDSSRRFQLIRLREQQACGFKNLRVPAYDREIAEELLLAYDKKLKEEEKLRKADDADSHHLAVTKYMQKIREQIMQRFRIASSQKTFSDMVYEEAVPNVGIILPSLMKIAQPKRPLKPVRKQRKTVTAQNLQATEVKLLVNIVRAFGIPVRSEINAETQTARGQTNSRTDESINRALKLTSNQSLVRPFIEAMFQHHVVATSTADGPNPSWNEELCIPFRPPQDDYSATNLQTVNDLIYLNLFDEYIVDLSQEDRERSSTVHHRAEKRWLGSIHIPFSTIYANGRIDGTFRINKPPVLLGYSKENYSVLPEFGTDIVLGDSEHTYITMFMTIEPQLSSLEPLAEKFDSLESDQLLLAAGDWQEKLEGQFPKRDYKTRVINFEAKSVFIMRYIKPLNPPEEIIHGDHLSSSVAAAVARYVSLVPSVSDSVIFPGLCDIWSTSTQFLQMLQGDEEEHAVLLTNYFLFLGKSAWLVIGSAVPEGKSAYVLTKEENGFWLWNATTGEHFSSHDNYCPLQSVGCIINADNIWGNIQPNDKPSQMSFNLSNSNHWKPLFHKGCPNPGLGSIQIDQLTYSVPNKGDVLALQEKVEAELKKKISDWRTHYITRWNRYCIQTFRKLLIQLEESQGKGLQEDHSSELEQVVSSYKLSGFPINVTYTEMKSIVDHVFATGVHDYESSDVEFALAVHIQPYPNHVLSVWIYVASLVRKRS